MAQGAALTIAGVGFEASARDAEITVGPHPLVAATPVQWADSTIIAQLASGVPAEDVPAGEMTLTITNTDAAGAKFTASYLVSVIPEADAAV